MEVYSDILDQGSDEEPEVDASKVSNFLLSISGCVG